MEKIFDTHAHYFDRKYDEIDGADTFLSGKDFWSAVCGVVNVGTRYENSLKAIEQAKKYENMYVAVGIHPSDAQSDCRLSIDEGIKRIRSLVSDKYESASLSKHMKEQEKSIAAIWSAMSI